MTDIPNLETFAVQFIKLTTILEQALIEKQVNVDVWVSGNLAMANAKGEADALGTDSVTQTEAFTKTATVQGVGSSSESFAQSLSASPNADWHL
jgi:hypothetical protein